MGRTIIYSDEFNACVTALGGYRLIDIALETAIDGLRKNPFEFEKFEHDTISFRYARTTQIGSIPPLYVIFQINHDTTVTLLHVEEII